MHSRNRKIIEVGKLLGRSPASVAMKLTNLASLDPTHKARGVKGLSGHSHLDEEVWQEFQEHWAAMAIQSEQQLERLRGEGEGASNVEPALDLTTEMDGQRKIRTVQRFFRKAVLAAYDSTCCITGNPVEASSLCRPSDFSEHRLNPCNGRCLAAHFDRAFDCGLISFDSDLRLLLSERLTRQSENDAVVQEFGARAGKAIILPIALRRISRLCHIIGEDLGLLSACVIGEGYALC